MTLRRAARLLWAAAFTVMACGGQRNERPAPILLIGVDGFEWSVVLPLLREGRMPHLAALMEAGNYGKLQTMQPTKSPIIWTSIATGKQPTEHGILDFAKPAVPGAARELYSNADRSTKALWNILSEHERRVAVIGWWMTYPVEPVAGVMVAQTNTVDQLNAAGGENIWKGRLIDGVEGQVWPPELAPSVMRTVGLVEAALDRRLIEIFGAFPHPLSELGTRLWSNCRWAFRADAIYRGIAEQLLEDDDPFDLLAVYFGGPDVVGHRFWRYRRPSEFEHAPTPEQLANFGAIIDDYYVWIDQTIGALVARSEANARVIVVADHGMGAVNQDRRFDPDDPPDSVNSGHHLKAPPGVIVAAGQHIARSPDSIALADLRRGKIRPLSSILEIAPTILALLEVPIGQDFAAKPSRDLVDADFVARHPARWVESHDTEEWTREHRARSATDAGQPDRVRQLRELGYIETE